MEILLDGLPVGEISTSMTINSPAAMIWAMYIVAAEKAGVPRAQLTGTLQNDILKEFIAQKEYIFPPAPSLKLVTDTVEWGTRELPRWNTISISGYHIREAGSTAVQELAFTIADGIAYVEDALARGLRFDDFAPRLSLLLQQPQRLLRGDRQVPGRAPHLVQAVPRALRRRERAQHLDALPHPDRRRVADRAAAAQQPHAGRHPGTRRRPRRHAEPPYRCVRRGVGGPQRGRRAARPAPAADPGRGVGRGQHGRSARRLVLRRDAHEPDRAARRGPTSARSTRWAAWCARSRPAIPQAEIADAAYEQQRELEANEREIVGVTKFADPNEELTIPLLEISEVQERRHLDRLARVRAERDASAHAAAMRRLEDEARRGDVNLMPAIVAAVEAYATIGEMCGVLRGVYGEYREPLAV